jgi:hypothetical protein
MDCGIETIRVTETVSGLAPAVEDVTVIFP